MAKKLHLLEPSAIVRSVLTAQPATAACGMSKVYTREGVDSVVGSSRKACTGCLAAVGEEVINGEGRNLLPAMGWLALLERVWQSEHEAARPVDSYKYTITASKATTIPLAA